MDGSNLVLIVVPVAIPLVLAIGIALPFIADRDAARAVSPSRQLDRAPQPGASLRIAEPVASRLGERLRFSPTAKT
jgi:hypothetical protein